MKGMSKLDAEKVRHCETTKEMLDILQCLHGGGSHKTTKEIDESYCLSSEPKPVKAANTEKKKRKKKKKTS